DAQPRVAVVERVLQHSQQPRVLRKVVGADAQELAQLSQHLAACILNQRAVTCRAGVAARAAVAVRADPAALVPGRSGCNFGGRFGLKKARMRGHEASLPDLAAHLFTGYRVYLSEQV